MPQPYGHTTIANLVSSRLITSKLGLALGEYKKFVAASRQDIVHGPQWRPFVVGGVAALLQGQIRATRDIDIRVPLMNSNERRRIMDSGWKLTPGKEEKIATQFKAFITVKGTSDRIKVDGVLCDPESLNIYTASRLITDIDGITVAKVPLLLIIKLHTVAMRSNTLKIANDMADLLWCLEVCAENGLAIPDAAVQAGFVDPAGWDRFRARVWKYGHPQYRTAIIESIAKSGIAHPQNLKENPYAK